jgi:hypothetical protein
MCDLTLLAPPVSFAGALLACWAWEGGKEGSFGQHDGLVCRRALARFVALLFLHLLLLGAH